MQKLAGLADTVPNRMSPAFRIPDSAAVVRLSGSFYCILRLTALGCAIGLCAVSCVPAAQSPQTSDANVPQPDSGLAPVEIRSVDFADYPRLRLRFSSAPPQPAFARGADSSSAGLASPRGDQFRVAERVGSTAGTLRPVPAGGLNISTLRTEAEQLNLVLIVDSTRSMPAKAFRRSLAFARGLAGALQPDDRMAIYSLAGEPSLLTNFTGDRVKLAEVLGQIQRQGKTTRVYDTLYSGLYTAQQALGSLQSSAASQNARLSPTARRASLGESRTAVLLLTDARDEDSFLSDEDCRELSELGRRMSIPIFVGVYSPTAASQIDRLQRLSYISGGQLIREARADAAASELNNLRRLPRAYFAAEYTSPAAMAGEVWPGVPVQMELARQNSSSGSEYVHTLEYRVPFGIWLRAWLSENLLVGILLALLLLLLLLLLFWLTTRRRRERLLERERSQVRAETIAEAQASIPPMPATAQARGGEEAAVDGTPDIAPYLLASHADGDPLPGEVRDTGSSDPAGVLMDDERTLYMREYTYRTTQLAVRQGPAYQRAMLISERPGETRREYDLFLDTTVLGSGRWSNIPLRDPSVSAVHAKIKRIDGRFVLYDLLSAGGVYVNGRKLLRPRALREGDELRIGRSRFSFHGRGTGRA